MSKDAQNKVIGLARDKKATEQKVKQEGLTNVTIIQADITNRQSLFEARNEVTKLVGGTLDYLINNAALVSGVASGRFLDEFEDEAQLLEDDINDSIKTNVIGVINTINVFLPLLKKSAIKKVATLTSGMGDLDVVNNVGVWEAAPYSISKAAVNMVVAKYNARYKDDGILFLAISPGVVDTGAATRKSTEARPNQMGNHYILIPLLSTRVGRSFPEVPQSSPGLSGAHAAFRFSETNAGGY